ncbi:MAG: hypothetical protein A3E36_03000 [Candidatus Andersenbacteria bacterium RIFCSPHIGHO2_12_FULL_45_11b]|uniref:Gcp-like domain-containing protein n=1 Tax=Candidatus Andersenbacteria bacterium RIFCSPHIGHO2_12_FULL_45_11b TaxID=1797282 RepID=A0A1G1XBL2_9BACT|nr:MAG: hypothetical protein A3E36_03000 [Candidatus Andersenbacteria bacterium RIFCSPHIGHO2_12_FULL_45_11b]
MNPLIFIIDTAHPTARIILADDTNVFGKREWENTPKVGTTLLVNIEELLQEAGKQKMDITRVAVHAGPGSYGLVRTGIVTATVLGQAVGAEIVAVSGDTEEEVVASARTAEKVDAVEPKYRNVDSGSPLRSRASRGAASPE